MCIRDRFSSEHLLLWCPAGWLVSRQLSDCSLVSAIEQFGRVLDSRDPNDGASQLVEALRQYSFLAYTLRGQSSDGPVASARP
eukprot:5407482-Alexandrium_andersonii.AAC.1